MVTRVARAYVLYLGLVLTAFTPFAMVARAGEAAVPARPTLGAIRWDGWFRGNSWQRNLDPRQWHHRLPFYGREISHDKVEVHGDTQEIMDREIRYASAAGLDYWAFLHYQGEIRGQGVDRYNYGLRLYLASRHKADIHFCLIIYPVDGQPWTTQARFVVNLFQEPSYQTVLGGRPLLYLLTWGDPRLPETIWKTPEKSHAAIDLLRKEAAAAGGKDPYIVVQSMWPERSARYAEQLGLDAISAYTSWTTGNYAELASENRKLWEACKATGKPLVPVLNAGWDPRPRQLPGGPQPTPAELHDHVLATLDWTRRNRQAAPAQTILAYAWNESDEGGWLVPTHQEGTARLDAVRDALLEIPMQ